MKYPPRIPMRYDFTPAVMPGPADIAWARDTLEKARSKAAVEVAKDAIVLATKLLLDILQTTDPGWRPSQSKEGPRR